MSSWLTRRRARKTQAEVDAERKRLQEIYDDDALVADVKAAIDRLNDPPDPPRPPPLPYTERG